MKTGFFVNLLLGIDTVPANPRKDVCLLEENHLSVGPVEGDALVARHLI